MDLKSTVAKLFKELERHQDSAQNPSNCDISINNQTLTDLLNRVNNVYNEHDPVLTNSNYPDSFVSNQQDTFLKELALKENKDLRSKLEKALLTIRHRDLRIKCLLDELAEKNTAIAKFEASDNDASSPAYQLRELARDRLQNNECEATKLKFELSSLYEVQKSVNLELVCAKQNSDGFSAKIGVLQVDFEHVQSRLSSAIHFGQSLCDQLANNKAALCVLKGEASKYSSQREEFASRCIRLMTQLRQAESELKDETELRSEVLRTLSVMHATVASLNDKIEECTKTQHSITAMYEKSSLTLCSERLGNVPYIYILLMFMVDVII